MNRDTPGRFRGNTSLNDVTPGWTRRPRVDTGGSRAVCGRPWLLEHDLFTIATRFRCVVPRRMRSNDRHRCSSPEAASTSTVAVGLRSYKARHCVCHAAVLDCPIRKQFTYTSCDLVV